MTAMEELTLQEATPSTSAQAEDDLPRRIAHIARVVGSPEFPTGDRAALRRMVPGQPVPMAFYRFALRYLPEDWEARLADWVTVVAGMAIMHPAIHRSDVGLGAALAKTGYSEARLERLLASEGDIRRSLLLRAARFAGAKGAAFNWTDGARLLLTKDAERRERLYRRIARDFYFNLEE